MSPEMYNSQPGIPCSTNKIDVWALGCILYELCTGRKAFPLDSPFLFYIHHRTQVPQVMDLSRRNGQSTVRASAVAHDGERMKHITELWNAMESLLEGEDSLYERNSLPALNIEAINKAIKIMLNTEAAQRPSANQIELYATVNMVISRLQEDDVFPCK